MRAARAIGLGLIAASTFSQVHRARAQDVNRPVYFVSYIDVSAPAVTRAPDILRQMKEAARRAAGVSRYEVLQRLGSPSQFAILEMWRNQQTRIEYLEQPQTRSLRAGLDSFLLAPMDERLYAIMVASDQGAAASADAIYAVAHIDVLGPNPAGRDAFFPTLKAFSEAFRRVSGNIGCDLLEQSSRTNHFEMVESWANEKSAIDHEVSALNREFRAKLAPVSSSPYDRRLFKALQ